MARKITNSNEYEEIRYKELVDSMSSGVAVYGAIEGGNNFIIREFNRAAQKIEGVTKDDVLGRKVTDVFPGVNKFGLLDVFRKVYKTGKPMNHPISLYKDNRIGGWRENYVYKLPTGEIVTIYDDVTEKKKVELSLKESEEKYKNLFENANDAIFIADAKTGILLEVNKSAERLAGRKRRELIGMHQSELHDPKKAELYKEKFKEHVSKKKTTDFEAEVLTKKGVSVPVYISSSIFDIGGKKINMGIFRDITDRVYAEKEREKLQEQLRKYAKQLELKVKKLERSKVSLNEKEKLVLFGLTAHPYMNDAKLSDELGIKRSTITSIRNRLKEKGVYRPLYIPNLVSIGCTMLSFVYGSFNEVNRSARRHLEFLKSGSIHSHATDKNFIALYASKNFKDFQDNAEKLFSIPQIKDIFEDGPHIIHIPIEITSTFLLFDMAPLLKNKFGIEKEHQLVFGKREVPKRKLSRNMKEIMYALVKYPEMSTNEIAKKLRLTRVTVAQNKKILLEEGFIQKLNMPHFGKLNFNTMALKHIKFNPIASIRKDGKSDVNWNPHEVIKVIGNQDRISLNIYDEYSKEDAESEEILEYDKEMYAEKPNIIRLSMGKTKLFRIDFAELTKKALDIKEEI